MKRKSVIRKKATARPVSDVHSTAETVVRFLESKAKKIDKTTLAKYVAVAVLVIYGIRKSNILGSLAISLVTGVMTKFMADTLEIEADKKELIPVEVKP